MESTGPRNVLLASVSPRRRELLESAGFTPRVMAPHVDESQRAGEHPEAYVRRLAAAKAEVAISLPAAGDGAAPSVVVAADTAVVHEGRILGKPESISQARDMLWDLSDRWHQVLTGYAVLAPGEPSSASLASTRVRFKALASHQIDRYLAEGEWMDKAGGYGIQSRAAFMVAAIEGSYTNVVGLPLAEVVDALEARGVRARHRSAPGLAGLPGAAR